MKKSDLGERVAEFKSDMEREYRVSQQLGDPVRAAAHIGIIRSFEKKFPEFYWEGRR